MSTNLNPLMTSRCPVLFACAGALALLVGLGAGCNKAASGPLSVPLTFTPNRSSPLSGSLSTGDVKIHLMPIGDTRENKEEIGQNREGATPVPVYAAGTTPAEFVHDVLETELKNFGADVTDAPGAADRVISIELQKFYAEEAPGYRGEVVATAEVTDKGGRRLWGKERVAGQGTNTGRSLSVVNYNQTYSDAVREMIRTLLSNPGFMKALTR